MFEASDKLHPVDVDVLAYFTDEGLYRDIDVAHGGGGTSEDNPPLTPELRVDPAGSPTTARGCERHRGTDHRDGQGVRRRCSPARR